MGFDEEWGQARAQASTRMQLASATTHDAAGGGGGSGGDLVHSSSALSAVAKAAYDLYFDLHAAGKLAKENSEAAASSLTGDGFRTGAALSKALGTWGTQVRSLMDACAHIQRHLEGSNAAYHEREMVTETTLQQLKKNFS
ncbi:hypothetical protein [Streptomyces sp. TP-A0874]|uniref:hypothetical protein n=1 Tax=Streptomyces sp. TP-A0874 TaxID=549819 RepID=UPI000853AA6D|nr:hypothetical protein [Streptomyces sp. TP-A0874]